MAIILHIDMDAFFSSVEERERPGLKGLPVIVGADPKEGKGRGVVSTCNYTARKFGVRSGMPISHAYKLCPNGAYLPVNYELYSKVSEEIMQILKKYSSKFEQASIDEAYLDISDAKTYEKAEEIAKKIKQDVKEKQRLTGSAGIGPNKLIAKISSDFQKPDGLTIILPENAATFISPMSVRKIPGIGPKTEEALKEMEITTIGELAKLKVAKLFEHFGKYGLYLHEASQGKGDEEVYEVEGVKSISREHTFEHDTIEPQDVLDMVEELSPIVHEDIVKQKYTYKTVTIKVRYHDFEEFTRAKTLEAHHSDLATIINTAKELFEPFLNNGKAIRKVGVRVSSLKEADKVTLKKWIKS